MHRNVNNNKAAKIIFRSLSDVRDNKTIISLLEQKYLELLIS